MANRIFITFITLLLLHSSDAQTVKKGMVNIADQFIQTKLDGEWEAYLNQIIEPGNFDSIPKQYGTFPQTWEQAKGYATYRTLLILNPEANWAIFTPPLYGSFECYFNGQLISQNGKVGTSKETNIPRWESITLALDHKNLKDTNELVIHIANYRHSRGGPIDSIVLGPEKELMRKSDVKKNLDIFLSGALVMGGLFFLGLFLYGKQQLNILYFSLFCIAFSYYVVGSTNYVLHSLLPNLPWNLTVRLEYGFLYASILLIVKFTKSSYPEETPKTITSVYSYLCYAFLAMVVITPPYVFTFLHIYFLYVTTIMIGLALYIYTLAAIHLRVGSGYSLISMFILILILVLRALNIFGLIPNQPLIFTLGYMAFFFLNSLTLSQQFAMNWKKAKEDAEASLRAKSDFLSIISHEIRTPMNAVIGMTHHLEMEKPREDQKETITSLKFASENLLSLINNILDFNKIEAGKIEFSESTFDLRKTIQKMVSGYKSIAADQGNIVQLNSEITEPMFVISDQGKLSQVLSNLISNAIKFTNDGIITVSIEVVNEKEGEIACKFSVKDTGIGIATDKIDKIFEAFSQAESDTHNTYGGTGLGLSISKKLLSLLGAELMVSSKPGFGTEFYFIQTFKRGREIVSTKSTDEGDSGPNLIGYHILLVEDNAMNVLVVKKYLSKWGVTCTLAQDGQQALDLYDDMQMDAILMDIQMPIMDGYDATKALRERGFTTPIIALTAAASEDITNKIKDAGMNDFVIKPYHPDELFQKLKLYLGEHPKSSSI